MYDCIRKVMYAGRFLDVFNLVILLSDLNNRQWKANGSWES